MPEPGAYLTKLTRAADDLALRHRPCGWGIALADSITHMRESDWDEVVGARFFMGRDYLGAIERARPPRMSFRYALCYDGMRPVAAAAYQVIDIALDAFGSRVQPQPSPDASLRDVVRKVRRNALRTVGDALGESGAQRLLINGNGLVTGEHGFAIAPGVDPRQAMHGLADATYRIRRAEKLHGGIASVLIKEFSSAARGHADELLRFGYHPFEVDPNMAVEIDPSWRSLEDYLATFTAKYRRKAKDARKQAKRLHSRRLSTAEIVRHAAALHELYLAVHEKASFRLANPGPDYFPSLAEALGDDLVLRVWSLDDALVGCSAALGRGDGFEAHMVGLDYEHNHEHGIYQNALYDFVGDAIARGVRSLSMGRTALEIKSSIGATPRPMTCFMRHANPLGNRLIAPLVAQIEPTPWTPRNPRRVDDGAA
ncbi:MAG: GNAT family N-acetyltransferase [Deltaproteobacteria bacterium]|nr:GNAT family N-acetyltransferase [Nannocystaceae bacterium]